jgi:predicted alpha-1,2-mannosidase
MDYAYDDWAMANVARVLGYSADADRLTTRAANYRNFYDPAVGFVRPRLASGQFAEPFTPNETGYSAAWKDFTESNAWQATFAVQHDPEGLANLLGGRQALVAKLDALFAADPTLPDSAAKDIAGPAGQYAHGNEPWKTQQRVSSLLESMYDDQPGGLAGNEDCGQMSSWYVLSAIGFYPVDPVRGVYVLGSPLFDRVSLPTAGGRNFVFEAR